MLRGQIRLVDFGQTLPGESREQRPAVIVSNDGANFTAARLGRGVITVAPMTSNVTQVYPFQVLVQAHESGLDRDGRGRGSAGASAPVLVRDACTAAFSCNRAAPA